MTPQVSAHSRKKDQTEGEVNCLTEERNGFYVILGGRWCCRLYTLPASKLNSWAAGKPWQRPLETAIHRPHDFAKDLQLASIISVTGLTRCGWLLKMYHGHAAHISLSIFLFLIKTQRSISAAQMLSRSTDTLIWIHGRLLALLSPFHSFASLAEEAACTIFFHQE